MSLRGRETDPSWRQVRTTVWFWPIVSAAASLVLVLLLLRVRPDPDSALAERTWPGDPSSAGTLLTTVATSVITAAGLTFSLTVVALQLASQQFSPRLLRSFARDGVVQAAMGVLLSTFVVALTALRGLDPERPLPVLALLLAQVMGVVGAVMLVVFVGHLVRRLRVDNMMERVHADALRSADESYALSGQGPAAPPADLPGPDGGVLLPAWRSGFVRSVDPEPLVAAAQQQGVVLLLGVRPGDSVVQGSPLGSAFADAGGEVDVEALVRAFQDAVALGFERTEEQDVAFGLRQLVDIALKAISPAVNDPTTAAEALGYCADLLVMLQGRRLGPQARSGADGTVRLVLPDRDLRYYLDLACSQVRRFGRAEPTVLTALLRLLRDCAVSVRDDAQRAAVAAQVDLVEEQLEALGAGELVADDVATVRDMLRRARQALAGDVDAAFRDRAGETRSV